MKSWKIVFICFLISLVSCAEDVDKTIQTDLPQEASQLYQLSLLTYEHLFFALLTLEEYKTIPGDSLPGCPSILLEEGLKRVTLTFDPDKECSTMNQYTRSGKIIIDLALKESFKNEWFVEFDNYVFESDSIIGNKVFTGLQNGTIQEVYSDFRVKSDKGLSYLYEGIVSHSTIRSNQDLLETVFSEGSLEGINPAGRNFSMSTISPIVSQNLCFKENQTQPTFGEEFWIVSRGGDTDVTHNLSYDTSRDCETTASMILPDGRKLILN